LRHWTADDAVKRGLDPDRTTEQAFKCLDCGEEFPTFTFRHEDPLEGKSGLIHHDGRPYDPNEWMWKYNDRRVFG